MSNYLRSVNANRSMLRITSCKTSFKYFVLALLALVLGGCGAPAQEVSSSAADTPPEPEVSEQIQEQVSQTVQAVLQIEELTEQVRQLTSKTEELQFQLARANERQKQLYDDIDYRLRQVERGATASNASASTAGSAQGGSSATSSETMISLDGGSQQPAEETVEVASFNPDEVRSVYDEGFDALRRGKYEEAIKLFEDLIARYPGSDLEDDSMYWIAEANYVTKKHDEALPAFERVVREFPNSQRAPEAMLKIGYIYYDREDYGQAKFYLSEVADSYPASRSAFSAKRRLDKMEREGL